MPSSRAAIVREPNYRGARGKSIGTAGVLVSRMRHVSERLSRLYESTLWHSIATREHLVTSMGTVTAEIEQGLRENARDETVQQLLAEVVVVALELSICIGGNLVPVIEDELRKREEFVYSSGEIETSGPAIKVKRLSTSNESLDSTARSGVG